MPVTGALEDRYSPRGLMELDSGLDSTSGMWLHAIPTASFRPSVDEFREIAAAYFGMPSPIASRFEGQPIYSAKGDQRGTCDK